MDGARPVAIIGATIAENLFPGRSALGGQFKARGQTFTVIAVLEKEGKKLLTIASNDANCLIPFPMFTKLFALSITGFGGGPTASIAVKGRDEDAGLLDLEYEMRGIMRNIRGLKPREEDNFSLNRPEMIASAIGKFFGVIGVVGGIIGSFAILVGGFGIANIMFVSVRERTNVIGIQKSLGAKNFFILFQFPVRSRVSVPDWRGRRPAAGLARDACAAGFAAADHDGGARGAGAAHFSGHRHRGRHRARRDGRQPRPGDCHPGQVTS